MCSTHNHDIKQAEGGKHGDRSRKVSTPHFHSHSIGQDAPPEPPKYKAGHEMESA